MSDNDDKKSTAVAVIPPKSRLDMDDAALRDLTTASVSTSFDERQLISVLGRTQTLLDAILTDPEAFTEKSGWNPKMLAAVTALLNATRGTIKDHADVATNNKHVMRVVEDHTKNFATATARHVSDELRDLSLAISVIMDETTDPKTRAALGRIHSRITQEIPANLRGVWRDVAKKTVADASEQLKLGL